MKVNGVNAKSAWEPEPLVFSRGTDENGEPIFIVIRAKGIKNFKEFNTLCPEPENKSGYLTKDGWQTDPEAPAYLAELEQWRLMRSCWIIIKTLEPSNIEWEKVKLAKPKTWVYADEELEEAFNFAEYNRIKMLIQEANSLNADKLEENRQTFFQRERAKQLSKIEQVGPPSDPENSKSGEPA